MVEGKKDMPQWAWAAGTFLSVLLSGGAGSLYSGNVVATSVADKLAAQLGERMARIESKMEALEKTTSMSNDRGDESMRIKAIVRDLVRPEALR